MHSSSAIFSVGLGLLIGALAGSFLGWLGIPIGLGITGIIYGLSIEKDLD